MGAGIVRLVGDSSFARSVLEADGFILVSFGAAWCGPCRLLAPALRYLGASRKDRLTVAKLDVDANPATTKNYDVTTFPVCILFRAGEEVARFDGYMPLRKLEAALEPYLGPA